MHHPDRDHLPRLASISAIVRRITWKLNGQLHFHGHPGMSLVEQQGLFDLGEASWMLDRIALLPGMAQAEESARRSLLELFDIFDGPPLEDPLPEGPLTALAPRIEGPPCCPYCKREDGLHLHGCAGSAPARRVYPITCPVDFSPKEPTQ